MHLLSFIVRRSTFAIEPNATNKLHKQTEQQPAALSDKRILNTCIFVHHTDITVQCSKYEA